LTGALITAGGLGVSENANVGGTMKVAGITSVTATTASTTSLTGALLVSGGLGVSKNVFANFLAGGTVAGSDAYVSQSSKFTASNFALKQTSAGATTVNAASGQSVGLSLANSAVLTVSSNSRVGILTASPAMELDVNGGVQGTSAYSSSSDRRWKKNIAPLQNSLAKVLNLTGVSGVVKRPVNPVVNIRVWSGVIRLAS
jgi:hypothetical protein